MTSGTYCVDANIFITPWNQEYPIDIFPSLWEQLAEKKEYIILIKPIFDEISNEPLKTWMKEQKISPTPVDDDIRESAILLQRDYKTIADGKGASPNDMLLIAYAQQHDKTIVTLEQRQKQPPTEKRNYKIPLICKKRQVMCIDFVALLRELKIQL